MPSPNNGKLVRFATKVPTDRNKFNHRQCHHSNTWKNSGQCKFLLFTSYSVINNGLTSKFYQNISISVSLHQITHIDGTQIYHLKKLSDIPKIIFDSLQDNLPKSKFGTITEVLDHISRVILQESCCKPPVNHSEIYTRVLHEYCEFLKFFLSLNSCKLKEDFSEINVTASGWLHRFITAFRPH